MITPADLCSPKSSGPKSSLDHPLDHLLACHRRIEERLATLERVVPHWIGSHAEALSAVKSCFLFFDSNGAWHTEDEELSLFPRLAAGLTSEEAAYLAELEQQHQAAEAAYAELKRIVERMVRTPVSDADVVAYGAAASRLAAIYRAHISSEDSRLPEIGNRLLDSQQLGEIAREMKHRRGL